MKVTAKLKRKSIVLSYKINNILYEVYVGITVNPERWSNSKKIIKGEGELVAEKNAKIKRYQKEIELYVFQLDRLGKEYFHSNLTKHLKNLGSIKSHSGSKSDFISYFQNFLIDKKNDYTNSTLKAYKTTQRHFSEFLTKKGKKSIAFESITTKLIKEFTKYLSENANLAPATRGKHVKNIKAIMNESLFEGLHQNRDFRDAKKENEQSPNIFLDIEELNSLKNFTDYSQEEQDMINVFLFMCFTGLRYSDYKSLKPQNISIRKIDDKDVWFLNFKQFKTNEEVITPIIYEEAIQILKKYNNDLPKYANAYMNRYIKQILKKHKLIETKIQINKERKNGEFIKNSEITIHTCRRSFCTNLYLRGIPIQYIMAASGHKSYKAFRLYIKADQLDKAKGLINYLNY